MRPAFRLLTDTPWTGASAEALAAASAMTDKDALATFRRAARLEPGDPDYHYILGDALGQLGRYEEAIPLLREAIRMSPRDPAYHSACGSVLRSLGRHDDAAAALREAARLQPDDVQALNVLGVALTEAGKDREALEVFGEATRLDRSRADLHNNLAVALWGLGREGEAVRAFRRALELQPRAADAHRNLGLALAAAGDALNALAALREVARLRPDDATAQLDLADALHGLGRHADADAAYDEAARLDAASFAARPHSQEARQAIALARIRQDLKAERPSRQGLAHLAGAGVFAAGRAVAALLSVPRRLATAFSLLAVAALGYLGWVFTPPHVTNALLKDDMIEISRAPVGDDGDVLDRLMHAVRERGLDAHVHESSFDIHTGPRWRTVLCRYEVPVEVVPGVRKTLHFRIRVQQPYLIHSQAAR